MGKIKGWFKIALFLAVFSTAVAGCSDTLQIDEPTYQLLQVDDLEIALPHSAFGLSQGYGLMECDYKVWVDGEEKEFYVTLEDGLRYTIWFIDPLYTQEELDACRDDGVLWSGLRKVHIIVHHWGYM